MRQQLIEMYLDYVNNFLSFDKFAEHYGISREFAVNVYAEGKRLHEASLTYNVALFQPTNSEAHSCKESSGLSSVAVREIIDNLKIYESVSIYRNGEHVGGAFVDLKGKTISFKEH